MGKFRLFWEIGQKEGKKGGKSIYKYDSHMAKEWLLNAFVFHLR